MRIVVPKETRPGERRVAATPKTVEQLRALGYDVAIETGAGAAAAYPDSAYAAAGAQIVSAEQAYDGDIVFGINAPSVSEQQRLRSGQVLISLLAPALDPDLVESLRARGVTALAMDAVPRISRAQALDVLSSMANLGGYRAVIEAASHFGGLFTGQVTAAGKMPPATVLVVGAGVAGLAAIGTANSLGAVVRAFDARQEVADQVESMGGQFLRPHLEGLDTGPSADGYAKEMGEEFNRRTTQMYREEVPKADIIITTALIPGRPAPRIIDAEMVASMKPGSVIVDMAAANGGNVAGSLADQVVTTDNGVQIIGYTPAKDGVLALDLDDVVQRGMTVTRDGQTLWPPPPVQVSAAPVAAPVAEPPPVKAPMSQTTRLRIILAGAVVFLLVSAISPPAFLGHFMVFMLSVVIGFYVIGNVHHALHTPLMSVTNAISGIIVVGALLQVGQSGQLWVSILAVIGVFVASMNVFGGFTVTDRMLEMFRREEAPR